MVGCSSRHGGRGSNGCCPYSTTATTSAGSRPTSPGSPKRCRTDRVRVTGGQERSDSGSRSGGEIRLVELVKSFDGVPAVTGIDLDIPAGQFYSLLGASGCGKTTTLRMIAGFEKPGSGRIELDGRGGAGDPPNRRPADTLLQNDGL